MAKVFLSYDRDDANKARPIALALEKAGHSVWWDPHVRGGAQFSKVIEEALKAADAVVVLWSKDSIDSAWVRDEAAAGRDSGRLLPLTIDGTEPPLGFRQFQTIDLSQWKGRGNPAPLQSLLGDVAAMGNGSKPPDVISKIVAVRLPRTKLNWSLAAAALVVVAIAGGTALWRPWATSPEPTLVIRAAADDADSRSLARNLAVRLASLQGVRSNPIRLVNEADAASRRPDLAFDIQTASAKGGGANLVLTSVKDGTIIWSSDFKPTNIADLQQQIALSAARVVECAGEGADPRQRLTGETLKLYLNVCAQMADLTGEQQPLVTALRQIVAATPRFAPAWRKLLIVEAQQVDDERDNGNVQQRDATLLRKHIHIAREVEPDMAEAILADVSLLPIDDIVARLQMLDRARLVAPDNPAILSQRSRVLRNVGRMRDSIDDADHAMQLDPLSPARHGDYLTALAFAGQIDSARQELQEVERLWPGSSTASNMEFLFNVRFGDARKALPVAEERGLLGITMYLEARLDPSKIDPYISWLVARRDYSWGRLGVLAQALGEFHRADKLYQVVFGWPNRSDLAKVEDVWFRPALQQFRRDPRFLKVMAETPLLKYWQGTSNWPDFCFEPDLPYDCKKEAARLER